MPEREIITQSDPCTLSAVWGVDERVMTKVARAADLFLMLTRRPVWIISGYRSRFEQGRLGQMGRPTADDDRSTHRTCPATGVDVSLGSLPPTDIILAWGNLVEVSGLRWGGGSKKDGRGIPSDWRHVDAGPR